MLGADTGRYVVTVEAMSARESAQAVKTLRQILALDQFHGERTKSTGLFEPVNVRDVRVIERGERLRFACQPGESVGIVSNGIAQDLQRHVATEPGIAGAINLAHTALADLAEDLVGAQLLADHHDIRTIDTLSGWNSM